MDKIKSIFEMVLDFLKNSFAKENLLVTLTIIVLIATLMAIIIPIIHSHFKDSSGKKAKISQSYKIFNKKSSKILPKELLGIRAEEYNGFLKDFYQEREYDKELTDLLSKGKNVIIKSPPLGGKTRLVYEVLKKMKNYRVSCPKENINEDIFPPNKGKKNVILLDDLQNYTSNQNFKPFLDEAIRRGFLIIATCKTGKKEENALESLELDKIFDETLEVKKMEDKDLAKVRAFGKEKGKEINTESFNGTMGSLFFPLEVMRDRFNGYDVHKKEILRAAKRLYLSGIYEGKNEYAVERIKKVCKGFRTKLDNNTLQQDLVDLEKDFFISFRDNNTIEIDDVYFEPLDEKNKIIINFKADEDEEKIFDTLFNLFKDDPKALFLMGEEAYSRGSFFRSANYLKKGIECFNESLRLWTKERFPHDYAMTQNNLGNAYEDLSEIENKKENLLKAIEYCNKALEIYTKERFPHDYAMTQNNLGSAHGKLAEIENKKENLQKAIEYCNKALEIYTKERFPHDYAMTQNNLGSAYGELSEIENKKENLQKAIECCNKALKVYTKERFLHGYAATQNNLGNAYGELAEIENKKENLQKAIECCNKALKVYTKERFPYDYAMTQNNLGSAYEDLAEIENKKENLQKAIECCNKALEIRTKDRFPYGYAMTQNNLGSAYEDLAEIENKKDNLLKAIECYNKALEIYTKDEFPDYHQELQEAIQLAQNLLKKD
jgi:tetratricopeptide (TPR) repeat protein